MRRFKMIGKAILTVVVVFNLTFLYAEDERGVILSGEEGSNALLQCSRLTPEDVTGFWTPSPSNIKKLETSFAEFAKNKKLPQTIIPLTSYYKQYVGFLRKKKKLIYVNAFAVPIKEHDWKKTALVVCDGGTSFFGVEYDIETNQFNSLEFNGES